MLYKITCSSRSRHLAYERLPGEAEGDLWNAQRSQPDRAGDIVQLNYFK